MTQAAALDFDHVELLIGTVENAADANAKAVRNTVLSPRFYTTDFDASVQTAEAAPSACTSASSTPARSAKPSPRPTAAKSLDMESCPSSMLSKHLRRPSACPR